MNGSSAGVTDAAVVRRGRAEIQPRQLCVRIGTRHRARGSGTDDGLLAEVISHLERGERVVVSVVGLDEVDDVRKARAVEGRVVAARERGIRRGIGDHGIARIRNRYLAADRLFGLDAAQAGGVAQTVAVQLRLAAELEIHSGRLLADETATGTRVRCRPISGALSWKAS